MRHDKHAHNTDNSLNQHNEFSTNMLYIVIGLYLPLNFVFKQRLQTVPLEFAIILITFPIIQDPLGAVGSATKTISPGKKVSPLFVPFLPLL